MIKDKAPERPSLRMACGSETSKRDSQTDTAYGKDQMEKG